MQRNFISATLLCLAVAQPCFAQDAANGAALYIDLCAVCHGTSLSGDGPMAQALQVPPSDLRMLAADGAFPIFDVAQRIDGRDPLVSHGGAMPIFGEHLQGDGADVAMPGPGGQPILMARPIADLVAFLMEAQQ